jgi:hypothetical protein
MKVPFAGLANFAIVLLFIQSSGAQSPVSVSTLTSNKFIPPVEKEHASDGSRQFSLKLKGSDPGIVTDVTVKPVADQENQEHPVSFFLEEKDNLGRLVRVITYTVLPREQGGFLIFTSKFAAEARLVDTRPPAAAQPAPVNNSRQHLSSSTYVVRTKKVNDPGFPLRAELVSYSGAVFWLKYDANRPEIRVAPMFKTSGILKWPSGNDIYENYADLGGGDYTLNIAPRYFKVTHEGDEVTVQGSDAPFPIKK